MGPSSAPLISPNVTHLTEASQRTCRLIQLAAFGSLRVKLLINSRAKEYLGREALALDCKCYLIVKLNRSVIESLYNLWSALKDPS